jgi:C4-type Zn-finger protein
MLKKGGENMTIEERLENVERELGRVKETLARLQVTGTVREIRARTIIIEDELGKARAVFGI